MKSPLFSLLRMMVALALISLNTSTSYACADAGEDDTVCGFTYTLQGSPIPGNWDILCELSAGIASFTEIDPQNTLVTITTCGYYSFEYTADDGSCIAKDTVEILFLDPSSADYNIGGDIELDYNDYGCHNGPPPGCGPGGPIGIGGQTPPEFIWSFNLIGNCSSTLYTTTPVNVDGCIADKITINNITGSGLSGASTTATQDEILLDFLAYLEGIYGGVVNDMFAQCPIPFIACPSPPPSPANCMQTVVDTNYYYIPIREGGQWNFLEGDTLPIPLDDSTVISISNNDYLFVVDPGSDFYGPDSLFFSLFQIDQNGDTTDIEEYITLQIQWFEEIRYDTIVDINIYELDTCAIVCGGLSVNTSNGGIPGPPSFDCGPVSLSFGPPDPCAAANVFVSIAAGTTILDCWNPCTDLFAFGSSECGPVSYSWGSPSSFACGGGYYEVEVVDQNGCSASDGIFINECFIEPSVSIATPDVITCVTSCVTLESVGSGDIFNWEWTGPNGFFGNGPSASVCEPGTYELRVTNFCGCETIEQVIVEEDTTPPTVTVFPAGPFCEDEGNQVLTGIPVGGVWSGDVAPDGSFSPASLGVGIFTAGYTYTDPINGCIGFDQTTFVINPLPFVQANPPGDFSVSNTTTQFISASPLGGTWSGAVAPDGSFTPSDLGVGNYSATYTYFDPFTGCFNFDFVSFNIISAPSVEIGGITTICSGGSTLLTATAGFQSYIWNGNANDQSLMVNAPGVYTVEVFDQNGGTSSASIEITEIPPIPPSPISESICQGDCFVIDNQSFCNSGNFDINLMAANGCDSLVQLELFILESDIVIQPVEDLDCDNVVVNIDASASTAGNNVSYNWSGAGIIGNPNASSIQVNQGGTYTLTLNNGNCSNTQNVTVVENFDSPIVDAGPSQEINCNNACVTLQSNATINNGTLAFEWIGPNGFSSTDLSPTVCNAGAYTLVVTASNGCSVSDDVEVSEIMAIPPTQISESLCEGDCFTIGNQTFCNTGNFDVVLSSAIGCDSLVQLDLTIQPSEINIQPVEILDCVNNTVLIDASTSTSGNNVAYNWSGAGIIGNPNASSIQVNQGGTYVLTLINGNCSNTQTVTVLENFENPIVDAGPSQEINCNNACVTLQSNATINNGTLAFEWIGPNGFSSTDLSPTVCNAGAYTLVVTASNGCSVSDDVEVSEIMAIPPTQISESLCEGDCFTIGNQTFCNTGNFDVVLSSAIGCDSLVQLDLTIQASEINIQPVEILDCVNNTVLIDASTSTSGNNVSYNWSGAGIIGNPNASSIQVNQGGTYVLTLINGNCSNTQTVTVVENFDSPIVDAGPSQEINCNNACVTLQSNATINNGSLTFEWIGPNGFSSTDLSPTVCNAGAYTLVVTASNGCSVSDDVEVSEIMAIPPTQISESLCEGDCFTIGNQTFCNTGNFDVVLSSAIGCDSLVQLDLTIQPSEINIQPVEILDCVNNTVLIDASTSTSGNNVSYNWSGAGIIGNPNASSIQVNQGGTYTLTLSNGNCSNTQTVTVVENFDSPIVDAGPSLEINCNTTCVTLLATASGNNGPLSYQWTGPNGFSSNDLNPMVCTPGIYMLEVFADNGCMTNDELVVNESLIQLSQSLSSTVCAGECITIGNETFCQDGNYTIEMQTPSGCDSIVNLDLSILSTNIEITDPASLNCINSMVVLDASNSIAGQGVAYTWSSLDGQIIGNPNTAIAQTASPGTYILTLNNNGCINQETVVINQEIDTLLVNAGVDQTLNCNTQTAQLTPSLQSINSPFVVQWSGPNGFSSNTLNPEVNTAGLYTISLINTSNGCSAEDVVKVETGTQLEIISQTDQSCADDATGSIIIEDVFNGTAPYQFAVDDNDFQSAPIFEAISIGDHQVQVMDAAGCLMEAAVEVEVVESFAVDLEPLYQTCAEEKILLDPLAGNNFLEDNFTYLWSDGSTDATRQLSAAGDYWVEISNGCETIQEEFEIINDFPALRDKVFLPNAFSPNDDQNNDVFKIESELAFADYDLKVYDRWGNLAFSTNNPTAGWDGRLNGRIAPIGVYAWILNVRVATCKGVQEMMESGDLTLLR